jgi:AcrR family transcriptional regulator
MMDLGVAMTIKNEQAKNDQKEDIFFRICNAILRLEVEKGHLGWKISDIARYADVTRSLIYYYFGKERQVIVEEAYRYMIELILDHEKGKATIQQRIANGIKRIKDMPYILVLFFLERKKDSEIGELIRRGEEKLLKRIGEEYPNLTPLDVKKIYILELGSTVFQDLDESEIENLFTPFIP